MITNGSISLKLQSRIYLAAPLTGLGVTEYSASKTVNNHVSNLPA